VTKYITSRGRRDLVIVGEWGCYTARIIDRATGYIVPPRRRDQGGSFFWYGDALAEGEERMGIL